MKFHSDHRHFETCFSGRVCDRKGTSRAFAVRLLVFACRSRRRSSARVGNPGIVKSGGTRWEEANRAARRREEMSGVAHYQIGHLRRRIYHQADRPAFFLRPFFGRSDENESSGHALRAEIVGLTVACLRVVRDDFCGYRLAGLGQSSRVEIAPWSPRTAVVVTKVALVGPGR